MQDDNEGPVKDRAPTEESASTGEIVQARIVPPGVGDASQTPPGGRWSAWVLEEHLAPEVSSFTHAEIPDVPESLGESRFWLANHFLNSIFRVSHPEPRRQFVFNFLRRADATVDEYKLARERAMTFLAGPRHSVRRYMLALLHWESFVSQACLALNLFREVFSVGKLYSKGDGSTAERLNILYNDIKHAEERIKNGEYPAGSTLAVWMTGDGLKSEGARLFWNEAADILGSLGAIADIVQDPVTMAEKVERLRRERPISSPREDA